MLKVIALIKRRADVPRADFRRHYEEVHAPLALRHLDQLSGYARNHVIGELGGGSAGFDCLTEFWYRDWDAARSVLAYMESPAAEPIRRDELTFMATAETVFFPVAERAVLDERDGASSGAPSKLVVLAARPPDEPSESFLQRWDAALPELLGAMPHAVRCVRNAIVRGAGAEPPWDAITMLWHTTEDAELNLPDGWPLATGRCSIVRVAEHATSLPQASAGRRSPDKG